MKVLGIQLSGPSTMGLLRMLAFTLAAVAMVEIADSINKSVWASEGSLSFIIGGFSGFLLNECGANFNEHGWRAFALLIGVSVLLFGGLTLVV